MIFSVPTYDVIHPHLLLPFLQGRTVDLKTLTLIEDHGDDDEGDAAPTAAAASTSGGGGGAAAASSSSAAAAEDANVDEEFERILRESEGN